jgi:hypothetical protein
MERYRFVEDVRTTRSGPEEGMRFEARAANPDEAERRLKLEIEAAFAC